MASKRLVASLAATSLLALMAAEAQAGGFATRQHSVTAAGQAYAGAGAAGFGLSGMFWNPAVVTSMAGRNSEWNLFGVMPQTRVEDFQAFNGLNSPAINAGINARGSGGEYGTSLLSTGSYNNYQFNENIFVGLSINAPYGSGTNLGGGWGGNFDVSRTRITSLNVQPVVGYRVNEQFSIAVGGQIQWLKVTQEQTIAPLGPFNSQLGTLTGDDIGYGFTLGMTWTPMPGTQLGIGFRSAVDHTLEGEQVLSLTPPSVPPIPGCTVGQRCAANITANITLPELVTVGIRQNITPDVAVSASVEWQNWSRARVVAINGSPTGSSLVLNYKDGWYFALGADWRVQPNLTLRAGIGYEITPVRDEFRSLSIPDSNRLWLSAGFTYDVTRQLSISGSYTFIQLDSERVTRPANADGSFGVLTPVAPGVATRIGYSATVESQIHIVGISASYRWDAPPPAVQAVTARY